jgi:hypothetical protein
MPVENPVDAFLESWRGVTASELATAQSFLMGLCDLLGVARPHPTEKQDYMFERPVTFAHGDGSTSAGRIDCYKQGHFVLEAKKVRAGAHTRGFDDALMRARAQGESYARALPASEGRPPFVMVVDVGHVIEVYSEFTRSGGTYTPFPDPRSHRITLDDLRKDAIRARLRAIWLDPMSLDPARANALVTRQVAVELAGVARSLEADGHSAHDVAAFLTRCLFSMFAEDVDLLPRTPCGDGAFVDLLKRHQADPLALQRMMGALWADMDRGGFSAALAKDVLHFNGKLFKAPGSPGYTLPLNRQQIDGLLAAARASWKEVEPSIFGTLLERALEPTERHALGAHYTPRAYVERLVLPTVVEPLRAEWADAQAAALLLANEANALTGRKRDEKLREAREQIKLFHHRLCTVRVLDPACGSGNFLYVTLEHLKRLEGEVLNQYEALGADTDAVMQGSLVLEGETVTLQQLRGIELNERAAALAELVLWIGFLQWQIRTFGNRSVGQPVVHDYGNIEHRDAVLAYDSREPMRDAAGKIVTRWDGVTFRLHPATGEPVPDETAQVEQIRYINPRKADWPTVDYIVGNPPFIGNKRMREALGDGYANALRAAWPEVPESADFVMYWWQKAADTVRTGGALRFGLITTNSLTMIFNRRIIEAQQGATPPLSLAFAIPDHPWVDSADGAAVRIAMSVGVSGQSDGRLLNSIAESEADNGEVAVRFTTRQGVIHSDLKVGANLTSTVKLKANSGLSSMGMMRAGAGFIVTEADARAMGLGTVAGLDERIRPFRNGRDLTDRPRGFWLIDLYGLTADQVRNQFPAVYQWVHQRVKPERDVNRRPRLRDQWWIFGEPRQGLRAALRGLPRYIATVETAKHRVFMFLDASILPDHKLVAIASADPLHLGVLSSRLHSRWALATGGTLEDRPVYSKSRCFDPFPFPDADIGMTGELAQKIATLAEQIDAHRKTQQAAHAGLTITGMYNVLEKLRSGETLTATDRTINTQGLVEVLRSLHDELDSAVLQAYGWGDLNLPTDTDELLVRLVELNQRRANEEAAGTVRWLRPSFQQAATPAQQAEIDVESEKTEAAPAAEPAAPTARRPWPGALPEQIKSVADILSASSQPIGIDAIAAHFSARGRWRERLPTILDTLSALGRARKIEGERWDGRQS